MLSSRLLKGLRQLVIRFEFFQALSVDKAAREGFFRRGAENFALL